MVPALWSLTIAAEQQHQPVPLDLLGIVLFGSLATSAAGCVINDLWDRDLDRQVARTQDRPLAARSLSLGVGIAVLAVAGICAIVAAAYLNPLSFGLSLAAIPIIAIYPACKRFFSLPQLVLSVAWGFAVLIPWAALRGHLDPSTAWLWAAVVLWTLGFDTVYALSDRPDDLKVGIRSSAIFFGRHTPTAVAVLLGLAWLSLLVTGLLTQLGTVYLGCWAIAGILWLWQSWRLHQTDLPDSLYPQLFRQNVSIGFILWLGMLLHPENLSFLGGFLP
jgi:4-hydroxybenzoate polyprenyltransferase